MWYDCRTKKKAAPIMKFTVCKGRTSARLLDKVIGGE